MDNDAEAIRQRMNDARASLTKKLDRLEHQVEDTYCGAKEKVQSVQRKIHNAKETVDPRRHVDRHPWAMLAGAAILGYAGTAYMHHRRNGNGNGVHAPNGAVSPVPYTMLYGETERGPFRIVDRPVPVNEAPFYAAEEPEIKTRALSENVTDAAPAQERSRARLGEMFHDEIQLLKGLALGTLFGIVRDVAMKAAPSAINQPLEEALNQITLKMGGKPIRGRIVPESWTLRRPGTIEKQP